MADENVEKIIKEVCKVFGVDCLKSEQREMMDSLLSKRDCMAILPTGYGKSLPYQMYLPLIRRLKSESDELFLPETVKMLSFLDVNEKIIVCCPLLSLMDDQVKRLECVPGLKAVYKGSSEETDELIKNGNVDVVFASPETLVGDSYWRSQFQTLDVGLIVVDEFHTITTWGGDDESEEHEVFRKWFRYVGELRSLFPKASILALTATCTNKIKKHVMKVMNLQPDTTTLISISPNRSNIKLVIKKIDNSVDTAMFWLIDSLDRLRVDFPKTLIYANSITDVSKLYGYTVAEVPDCKQHVEMFHSETEEIQKNKIIKSLNEDSDDIRVIFATNALGMGINAIGFHSIILYGSPKSVIDLVQELGRVGRDNENSVAILMHNSYHLRTVSKEVKSVHDTKGCRRNDLISNFMSENELGELAKDMYKHTCCDNCAKECKCGNCNLLPMESLVENMVESTDHSDSDTVEYEYKGNSEHVEEFSSDEDFLFAEESYE